MGGVFKESSHGLWGIWISWTLWWSAKTQPIVTGCRGTKPRPVDEKFYYCPTFFTTLIFSIELSLVPSLSNGLSRDQTRTRIIRHKRTQVTIINSNQLTTHAMSVSKEQAMFTTAADNWNTKVEWLLVKCLCSFFYEAEVVSHSPASCSDCPVPP